jgi:hypothetical protein
VPFVVHRPRIRRRRGATRRVFQSIEFLSFVAVQIDLLRFFFPSDYLIRGGNEESVHKREQQKAD